MQIRKIRPNFIILIFAVQVFAACTLPEKILGTDITVDVTGTSSQDLSFMKESGAEIFLLGFHPFWDSLPKRVNFYSDGFSGSNNKYWDSKEFRASFNSNQVIKKFHRGLTAFNRPLLGIRFKKLCEISIVIFPNENGTLDYIFFDTSKQELLESTNDSERLISGKSYAVMEKEPSIFVSISFSKKPSEVCAQVLKSVQSHRLL